jgi:hypothetical protein
MNKFLAAGLLPALAIIAGPTHAVTLSFLVSDQDSNQVLVATDLNGDGDTDDEGEAVLWFSGAANAAGYKLNTPNGIATGPDGAVYVVEADTTGSPTGDWVYRTQDLNGDGVIGAGKVGTFAKETKAYGALSDFAMDVGGGSIWTWQWLAAAGKWSVFKLTDLDDSGLIDAATEVAEAWSTTLLPAGYTGLAGFGMDYDDATGNILLAMNGSAANGKWIAELKDLDGDGLFLSAGETGIVLSKSDQGSYPARPRNVACYSTPDQPSPVPLPATLPLAGARLAGLAALSRRRVR